MTFPVPNPPLVTRTRLRLRWTRRRAARVLAHGLARLVARLDPPEVHLARARTAHPSTFGRDTVEQIEWHAPGTVTVLRPRGGAAS